MTEQKEKDHLTLKWGTLKSWNFNNKECQDLLHKWAALGSSASAMLQKDTPEQKRLICEMIDKADIEHVHLDWDGKDISKEEAKKYVMEYGK